MMETEQVWEPIEPLPPEAMRWRAGDPRWKVYFDGVRGKSDAWFATLAEGDIVHYDHGFQCFVRCIVVLRPLCRSERFTAGKPSLQGLVIVGARWGEIGDQTVEYWRRDIGRGRAFQPSAQFVYESPYYCKTRTFDPRVAGPYQAKGSSMSPSGA